MEVINKLLLLVTASEVKVTRALATLTLGSPDGAEGDGPHQEVDRFCVRVG